MPISEVRVWLATPKTGRDARTGAEYVRFSLLRQKYLDLLTQELRTLSRPLVIAESVVPEHQLIGHITLTHGVNVLLVGPEDGQAMGFFNLDNIV